MRKTKNNSWQTEAKKKVKKTAQKTKSTAQRTKKKIDEARQTSTWQKTKQIAKKSARIAGSHLATLRTSITLSNEESELMSELENRLKKINVYVSKSQILRAGLWSLRKLKAQELENSVKDLIKVKQVRIL